MFGVDDAVNAALTIGNKLIDRFIPDPAQAAAAKMQLLQMQQTGELAKLTAETDLLKGQLAINAAEAANPSMFIGGWRPFIGWVCGIVLACAYIPKVLAITTIWAWACYHQGIMVPPPPLDISDVFGLVLPLLGLSSLHTFEKYAGVATTAIASPKGHPDT